MVEEQPSSSFDAIIVGAGFAGLFMLHRLRERGFTARVLEAADGIGGTWYWNRYPGARCDIESMQYSYAFSEELQQEWKWAEVFSSQTEILRYLNHVADKFDLRKDIALNTRVVTATFDESRSEWTVITDRGERLSAHFCIMATGCLSNAKLPEIKGIDHFQGHCYHTGRWPHDKVQFDGQRVAVIGTGSSGIQSIPVIAKQAAHLYVFQRTPNFCIPARNRPLDSAYEQDWKSNYPEYRKQAQDTSFGVFVPDSQDRATSDTAPEQVCEEYEKRWQVGGVTFITTFSDILISTEANKSAADFVRHKIQETVKDPVTAECLSPVGYPIGAKRLCVDTDYFQTYNRDNVTLVDLRQGSIDEITPTGIRIKDKTYEVDSIVFATGFDAMTGALLNIDIHGRANISLRQKWAEGPRTYLGLMVTGFPNLFTITGPGSPSVLTNMVPSIELHVDIIAECLAYLRTHQYTTIEANAEAETAWFNHVNEVASMTLFSTADTWYNGANIPGKPKVFMPYAAGHNIYRQKCEQVVSNDYEGFSCA